MEILINERPLSPGERADLEGLEQTIRENFIGFVVVGKALGEIKNRRLYRNKEGRTFEAYCHELWDMCDKQAYRVIGGAQAWENLANWRENNPQVAEITLPQNESQARELARLTPEEQRKVWLEVVESAEGGRITASKVRSSVKRFKGEQLGKAIRKATAAKGENKTDKISEAFAEVWDRFWDQVEWERIQGWKHTSRREVYKRTVLLLEAVAEAGTRELGKKQIPMELSTLEKLKKAGFRIFRPAPDQLIIEEWNKEWIAFASCSSPSELSAQLKDLMRDPQNIRG